MRKSWLDGFEPRVFQVKSKKECIQQMTNCSIQLNTGNCIESGEMRTEAEEKKDCGGQYAMIPSRVYY